MGILLLVLRLVTQLEREFNTTLRGQKEVHHAREIRSTLHGEGHAKWAPTSYK